MTKQACTHLVFYDGDCGLCDASVQFILRRDRSRRFCFSPLQGETAKLALKNLFRQHPNLDSIVLMENFQSQQPRLMIKAQAVFRICWILGGRWKLIGWMGFLPAFLFNWGYDIVARNRHRFFTKDPFCDIPDPETRSRFLD